MNQEETTLLHQGIDLFNQQKYFESHEVLEKLWNKLEGQPKLFVQGLIQIAVAYHHIRADNYPGGKKLIIWGLEKLKSCPAAYMTVNTGELIKYLDCEVAKFNSQPDYKVPSSECPCIKFFS